MRVFLDYLDGQRIEIPDAGRIRISRTADSNELFVETNSGTHQSAVSYLDIVKGITIG